MNNEEKEALVTQETNAVVQDLNHILSERCSLSGESLFAILDAAAGISVLNGLFRFNPEHMSLFRNTPMEPLTDVAPYLVKPAQDSEMMQWLANEGWGRNWGIFFSSSAKTEDLFSHFRHFCRVRNEAGTEVFFRFYDPRILPVYLSSCTLSEADRFFGPAGCFFTEADNGRNLLALSLEKSELITERYPLSDAAADPPKTKTTLPSAERETGAGCIIRKTQMECLQEDLDRRRDLDLLAHARHRYPNQLKRMTDDARGRLITGTRETAVLYGIENRAHQFQFLDLTLTFGENFHESQWAEPILESEYLDEEDKMTLLMRYEERHSVQTESLRPSQMNRNGLFVPKPGN